jgi:phosphomannomutase
VRLAETLFRAYDMRGVVPTDLDADGALQVGRAYAAYMRYPSRIVVGHDVRLTGPELADKVVEGLTRSGIDVLRLGLASTDEFYFACATQDCPGVMVTASHNPAEYNGFKLVEAIPRLTRASEFRDWVLGRKYEDVTPRGRETHIDVTEAFDAYMLARVDVAVMRPLKVAMDASNGALGRVWSRLADRLPITLFPVCFEPDGSFPNHGNDIIQLENQRLLRESVARNSADVGLIFDPDGDRCLAVDDEAVGIPGDFLVALLAEVALSRAPGSAIVYDVRCSEAVPNAITAAGGVPVMWRPGHVYLKPKIKEHDAAFGGEISGHMYFRDFWYSDSGVLAGLSLLEYASSLDQPLSSVTNSLRSKYFLSGEINSRVADPDRTLRTIRERYTPKRESDLSGIGMWFDNWKFVVRPSDNESLVRLTVEADSQAVMEAKRDELLALIRS